MAYQIIIKQVTREQVKNREYKQVGTKEDGEPKYGYVDDETTEDVSREVYSQRLEELDVAALATFINKGEN